MVRYAGASKRSQWQRDHERAEELAAVSDSLEAKVEGEVMERAKAWLCRTTGLLSSGALPENSPDSAAAAIFEARRIIMAQALELRWLSELSLLDGLTGLYNWRGFDRHLRATLDESRRTGSRGVILCFDLDGFKEVNDQHGHAAGDAVLRAVAACIKRLVKSHDAVARPGGDEFYAVLTRIEPAKGMARARDLDEAINRLRVPFGGTFLEVRASVGVVPFGPTDSLEELLERADRRMYRQKRSRAFAAAG